MCSLLDIVHETFTFFQITGSDDVIFINNWWDFDVLGEIFIPLQLFFVWSRPTFILIKKTRLMGVITLKYIILKTGRGLKLLFLVEMLFLGNLHIFHTPTRRVSPSGGGGGTGGIPHYPKNWLVLPPLSWPKNANFVIFIQFLLILPKLLPPIVDAVWETLTRMRSHHPSN